MEMMYSKKIKGILDKRGIDKEDLEIPKKYPEYKIINMGTGTLQFKRNIMGDKLVGILYDVDTDGLSSGKIMTDYLKALGVTCKYTMNKSKKHGMNKDVMEWVKEEKIEYLIVVDAGINDIDYYRELENKGVDVLVLDHHKVKNKSILVSNGNIEMINCNYEGSENVYLSGAGVVYRFIKEMNKTFKVDKIERYKIWVGLSVLSDRCNILNKENRYYVKYLYDNYRKEELFNRFINYGSLENMFNFKVIPLLNSCIRMGREDVALELVNNRHPKALTKKVEEGLSIQLEQKKLVEDALDEIVVIEKKNFLVGRVEPGKYDGIIGLISSNLKNKYGKPNIVITKRKDVYSGSFRGTDYIDSDILDDIGIENKGHKKACGVFIKEKEFKEKVSKLLGIDVDTNDVKQYEYLANESEYYLSNKDIWRIAILNEYSGEGFEKIKVKIAGIGNVPRVKEYDKITRYEYRQFEVVEFDMNKDVDREKSRSNIIVTPVLNKERYTLVKE